MCIYIYIYSIHIYIQYIYIYTVYIYIQYIYSIYIYIQLYSHCILMSPRIFTFILYTFIHLNLSFAMSKSPPLWATARSQNHPVSALTHRLIGIPSSYARKKSRTGNPGLGCFSLGSVHCDNMGAHLVAWLRKTRRCLRVSWPSRSDSTRQKPPKVHLHRSELAWLLVSILW